jgi:UDP-glucose 4-epimerase
MVDEMKICLLGHSGFIGKNLFDELRTEHEIIFSDFRLDDSAGMAAFFSQHADFDVIIHAAGAVSGDTFSMLQTNLLGTFLLTESLRSQKKSFSMIFFSSGAVYGNVAEGCYSLETDSLIPVDYYGSSKKSAEDLLRVAAAIHGFGLAILRMPSVYGPFNVKGVLSRMMADAERTGEIKIFGSGKELRSFVDVRDVASVVSHLIEVEWSGTMNVSSGECFTTGEVAALVQRHVPARVTFHSANNLLKRMALDNTLMKTVSGFEPHYTLKGFLQSSVR